MTDDECLREFGLSPGPESAPAIRRLLAAETTKERDQPGDGDGELMKLNCVQLFSLADPSDVLVIWRAKQSSFDKAAYIDVQLLCGTGVSETKRHLTQVDSDEALAALTRIEECEAAGDFEDFTPAIWLEQYRRYYSV